MHISCVFQGLWVAHGYAIIVHSKKAATSSACATQRQNPQLNRYKDAHVSVICGTRGTVCIRSSLSVALLSQNGVMSNPTEKYKLKSCIRRKTDSIDKRFCFDIEVVERWVSALTTQYRCFKYLTLPEKYRKTYRPLLFTLVLLWTRVTVCLPWSTKGEIVKNVQALFFHALYFISGYIQCCLKVCEPFRTHTFFLFSA